MPSVVGDHKHHNNKKHLKKSKKANSKKRKPMDSSINTRNKKQRKSVLNDITAADLLQMEYLATELQKIVRTIIDKVPDPRLLEAHIMELTKLVQDNINTSKESPNGENTLAPELVILMRSQKVQLIANLKSMFEQGNLPLFKQIAEFDESTVLTDSKFSTLNIGRKSTESTAADEEEDGLTPQSSHPTGTHQMLYKKFPGTGLPALPLINNRALEARVFTHKSIVNNVKHLSQEDALRSHNERLEFLGDAILEQAVTEVIYKRFSDSNEGEMSRMRSGLVNNVQLAEYATRYGFDKKLHKDSTTIGQFFKGKRKPVADVFEAYIGGLAVDGNYTNLNEIRRWLAKVMKDKLDEYEKKGICNAKEKIDKSAKAQLYAQIGSASLHPEYTVVSHVDDKEGGSEVNCVMNGEVIGTGRGDGIKEASLKAAMQALKNGKAIAKYSAIRLRTPREKSVILSNRNKEETKSDSEGHEKKRYKLPVEVTVNDQALEESKQYKNELYKLLASKKSLPEYKMETMSNQKMTKCILLINSIPVCYCFAQNGKIGGNICAKYILENKDILQQCYVF